MNEEDYTSNFRSNFSSINLWGRGESSSPVFVISRASLRCFIRQTGAFVDIVEFHEQNKEFTTLIWGALTKLWIRIRRRRRRRRKERVERILLIKVTSKQGHWMHRINTNAVIYLVFYILWACSSNSTIDRIMSVDRDIEEGRSREWTPWRANTTNYTNNNNNNGEAKTNCNANKLKLKLKTLTKVSRFNLRKLKVSADILQFKFLAKKKKRKHS